MSLVARRALLTAMAMACMGAGVRPPGLGDVKDIRVHAHPGYTRITIELTRQVLYQAHEIEAPHRLYIDIENTWLGERLREPRSPGVSAPVRLVRGGQNTTRRARVVFELDGRDHGYRTFHLKNPFRIVTDVYSGASRPPVSGTGVPSGFDDRPVRRVVIDPGHGGKDSGATRGRVREKDVVLRVSRELRTRLARNGFEVHMTRDSDTYLSVAERPVRANRVRADLFISIHANASPNRKTQGVETYLLDTRYDRQTARVAARENGTTIARLSDLELIKASLRLGYTERYAARLAEDVQASLVTRLGVDYRGTGDLGVKRGPFLVLFQADMPAILVEVGFLTHRSEAKRLDTRRFARAVADGIARGVIQYRDRHARSLVAER